MQGAIDICQIDACRMGGVNEVFAVLLMAKKYDMPIVPKPKAGTRGPSLPSWRVGKESPDMAKMEKSRRRFRL